MKTSFRVATMIYLILLGVAVGAFMMFGSIVVPVLMNSDLYLGIEAIGRIQEEILIAQMASYLSYVVLATLAAVVFYEGYKYKMFERDRVTVMAALGMLMTGLMFNYYYMPDLLAISSIAADGTLCDLRISVLKGSVIDFVSMIVFVVLLMVQNMKRACR